MTENEGNITRPVPVSEMYTALFTPFTPPPDEQLEKEMLFSPVECSESSLTPRMRVPPETTVAEMPPPLPSLQHDSILNPARVREEDKDVNSNTPPLPLPRVMSLTVVDVHMSDPLCRLNRGVLVVVDIPDTPLIIMDVSVSVAADWISNRCPPLNSVFVTESVNVFSVADAVTGNTVDEVLEEVTLSVISVYEASELFGVMTRSDRSSVMGAVSAVYSPFTILTVGIDSE